MAVSSEEEGNTLMSAKDDALSERSERFLVPGSSDNCCLRVSSRFKRLQNRGSSTLQQVSLSVNHLSQSFLGTTYNLQPWNT